MKERHPLERKMVNLQSRLRSQSEAMVRRTIQKKTELAVKDRKKRSSSPSPQRKTRATGVRAVSVTSSPSLLRRKIRILSRSSSPKRTVRQEVRREEKTAAKDEGKSKTTQKREKQR